jgi:hypothetical protein
VGGTIFIAFSSSKQCYGNAASPLLMFLGIIGFDLLRQSINQAET